MSFGPHGEIPTSNYGPIKKYYRLYGKRIIKTSNPEDDYFGTDNIGVLNPKYLGTDKPTEIIVGKPENIKLADAVTYDNEVRIPLGERDNFNIKDIRYGLTPFVGLAGLTLKNK